MLTEKQLENLKREIGHAFDVDEHGNLTLKDDLGIPPFKLIYVEGREFIMGDKEFKNAPQHKVAVSSFFISEYQVTQETYKAITGKEPSEFKGINHPIEKVSWIDAVEFCNLLNRKIGLSEICDKDYNFLDINEKKTNNIREVLGFRLPTEAEWEYAAKGAASTSSATTLATATKFAGSDNIDNVGWYNENNRYETKPVGLKFPNQLGLFDMSGNVFEWCWDWYGDDFYKNSETKNPVNIKKGSNRVLRGGSWRSNAVSCRLAMRYGNAPGLRWNDLGFRLMFALQFNL